MRQRPPGASPRSEGAGGRSETSGALAELHHRDLVEEERLVDLARDRGSHLSALAAALDEDDDDDLGIIGGREGREPGVVLSLGGIALGDALGRARLAGHEDAGYPSGGAGATLVDGARERVAQKGPDRGRQVDLPRQLARR